MIFWYKICAEIRHMILLQLARAVPHEKRATARYARVSKEWQMFFEPYSFRSLEIQSADLKRFQEVFAVHRRRAYMQHLGLKITIPQHRFEPLPTVGGNELENLFVQMMLITKRRSGYDTQMPWIRDQMFSNMEEFDEAIRSLYKCLTSWTIGQVDLRGIKLEIIADSKSHWQEAAAKIRESSAPLVIHTPDPVVVSSHRRKRTLRAAELDFHFSLRVMDCRLPMVQVISSMSIMVQSVRQFEPNSIGYIVNCLPRLKTFIWVIRPHADQETERHFCKHLQETVHMWPASLKRVKLIQFPSTDFQRGPNPNRISLVSTLSTRFKDLEITSTCSRTNELLFIAKPANRNVPVQPDSPI
jgi:hypothetical protein